MGDEESICYEGEDCCSNDVVDEDNASNIETNDNADIGLIQLRTDAGPCFEGEDCCNSPAKKLCKDPKGPKTQTTNVDSGDDFNNYDDENTKLFQLRSDSYEGPCYEGEDCCNPVQKVCKRPKSLENPTSNAEIDYNYNDEENIKLLKLRTDNEVICYENQECCNDDVADEDIDYNVVEDDINLIKLRSDNYNEYVCEELGISNIASIGDVSEDFLDALDPDEEDANIVHLGVRTASNDCVCQLPKKRCDLETRLEDDYEEGEEIYDPDYNPDDEEEVIDSGESDTNKYFKTFPL